MKLIVIIAIAKIIMVIINCISALIYLFLFEYPKFYQFRFYGLSHSIGFGHLFSIIFALFFLLSFYLLFLEKHLFRKELYYIFLYAFWKISAPSIDLKTTNA